MPASVDHSLRYLLISAAAAAAATSGAGAGAGASATSCFHFLLFLATLFLLSSILSWLHPGGAAWFRLHNLGRPPIPGPRGLPFLGSLLAFSTSATPHRLLSAIAASCKQRRRLMALSLASTRIVVSSHPSTARSILCSAAFSDRPLNQSARQLLFNRAIGFSPAGDRWRRLRRLSATHLFSPRRLSAHLPLRHLDADALLRHLSSAASASPVCTLRPSLQHAALNTIMRTVFGKSYAFHSSSSSSSEEAIKLHRMVREGFELLGAFNMADHLPSAFDNFDPLRIRQRCQDLVPQVYAFVQKIIDDHRGLRSAVHSGAGDSSDFVDVLLKLQEEEGFTDADIVSVLWEMIFRGSDTMAILTEWILAELTLHPDVQEKLHAEIASATAVDGGGVSDAKMGGMPYLQAVVKEGLRMHPPGPLLSWARLAIHDTEVDGYAIPAGTTAMVNMWAITHDPEIWEDPEKFVPERFMEGGKAARVEVGGTDMRLAPFGAGARSCPGKAMAMATVQLWVAKIVERFRLMATGDGPVDLTEVLKLSCEMAAPLTVRLEERRQVHVDS